MRLFRTNTTVLSALLLAACGGGGGGSGNGAASGPAFDAAAVRILTGASAPAETSADQDVRARAILARADSLLVSTAFTESDSPIVRDGARMPASCSGTRCALEEPSSGLPATVDFQGLELLVGRTSAILTKHGITITREDARDIDYSYHSWMDHAVFAAQTQRHLVSGDRVNLHYGLAGGDLAGTRPEEITGVWRGLMVGVTQGEPFSGNRMQGDATLTYTAGGGGLLDAVFTNIQDLGRPTTNIRSSIRFEDIPVRADGTYRAGGAGNLIQGGFYGPQHAEAAGVFVQSDIVGAFGAKRQLTGVSTPAETPADQDVRARAILPRSDSLLVSTAFAETDSSAVPGFQIQADCSGMRCALSEPSVGLLETVDLQDLAQDLVSPFDASAILTKYSITLMQGRVGNTGSLYSWMNHAAFAVQTEGIPEQGINYEFLYGVAAGDLAGTRPDEITGTWRGLMVGSPQRGIFRGNRLQGDAILTYTGGASSSIDAEFTDIRDIDRLTSYSTTSVRFDDIPVSAGGTYRAGAAGNRIQGGFYGPRHAEAAGVFEQADIVGAFGAKRQ